MSDSAGNRTALKNTGAAIAVFLACLALWYAVVQVRQIPKVILPTPFQVASAGWEQRQALLEGFIATGAGATLGLFSSVALGSLVAGLFSQSKLLRSAFYPYVIFFQTVPIVAIAPLLLTWSGYTFRTIVLVATIISIFPIVSNVTAGLISIEENLTDLFKLGGATRLQILTKLRIPSAVSHLVLGMRISAGLAVIGTIVGEFFVGKVAGWYAGIGALLTPWQNRSDTAAVIAAVFVSTLLGLAMLGMVNLCAYWFLRRWTAGGSFEKG